MQKRMIAMLLLLIMCVNLLAGCSTVTAVGTETLKGTGVKALVSTEAVSVQPIPLATSQPTPAENPSPLPVPNEKKEPGTMSLDEEGQLATGDNCLYCVRYGEEDYIIGRICDSTNGAFGGLLKGKKTKLIHGATVTLLDANKKEISDENGKPCTARTIGALLNFPSDVPSPIAEFFHWPKVLQGNFILHIPEDGDDSYEKKYYLRVEHEDYYTVQAYPVVYRNMENFKKWFQETALAADGEINGAKELLASLSEMDVDQLYEGTKEYVEDKAAFTSEYKLSKMVFNREAMMQSAKKVVDIDWDVFWDEVYNQVTVEVQELPGAIWQARPDRLRSFMLKWQADLLCIGAGLGWRVDYDAIGELMVEANQIMPNMEWYEDQEFLEFFGLDPYSLFMEGMGSVALLGMTGGLGGVAALERKVTHLVKTCQMKIVKSMDDWADTLIGKKPGMTPVLAGDGSILMRLGDDLGDAGQSVYLSEAGQKQINGTIEKLNEFDAGKKVNTDAAKKLQEAHPEGKADTAETGVGKVRAGEIKEAYLSSIDAQIARRERFLEIDNSFRLKDDMDALGVPENAVTAYLLSPDLDAFYEAVSKLKIEPGATISMNRGMVNHELGHLLIGGQIPDFLGATRTLELATKKGVGLQKLQEWFIQQKVVDVGETGRFMEQLGLGEFQQDFMQVLNSVLEPTLQEKMQAALFGMPIRRKSVEEVWNALWDKIEQASDLGTPEARLQELNTGGGVWWFSKPNENRLSMDPYALQKDYAHLAVGVGGPAGDVVWDRVDTVMYDDLQRIVDDSKGYVSKYLREQSRKGRLSIKDADDIEHLFGEQLAALVRLELYKKCQDLLSMCKKRGMYEKIAAHFELGDAPIDITIFFRDGDDLLTKEGMELERIMRESFGENYRMEHLTSSQALEEAVEDIAENLEQYRKLFAERKGLQEGMDDVDISEGALTESVEKLKRMKKEIADWDLSFDATAVFKFLKTKLDSYQMLLGTAALYFIHAGQVNASTGFAEGTRWEGWDLQTKDTILMSPVEKGGVEGIVVDKETGAPIKGARLELSCTDGDALMLPMTSGSDGSFKTDVFRAGSYILRVSAEGYQKGRQHGFTIEKGRLAKLGKIELIPLIKTTPTPSSSVEPTPEETHTVEPTVTPTVQTTVETSHVPAIIPTAGASPTPTVKPTVDVTPQGAVSPTITAAPTMSFTPAPAAAPRAEATVIPAL